jgi:nitrogen fixation NifU-like protein
MRWRSGCAKSLGYSTAEGILREMDDLYRDYILEHYRRPHNFGVLDAPTASYEGSNPLCGDRITMMLGIHDGIVSEVAFTGRGCAISQASASLLTDEIKGKTVAAVEAMTPDDLLDLLGIDISPARLKCALLSLDTVAHALADESAVEGKGAAELEGSTREA